jgi:hypothetical protein
MKLEVQGLVLGILAFYSITFVHSPVLIVPFTRFCNGPFSAGISALNSLADILVRRAARRCPF